MGNFLNSNFTVFFFELSTICCQGKSLLKKSWPQTDLKFVQNCSKFVSAIDQMSGCNLITLC